MLAGCWARLSASPEADGTGKEAQGIHEAPARGDAPFQLEGNHAARLGHLPLGQGVLREGFQARVVNDGHLGMGGEIGRHPLGIEAVTVHAQGQGLESAQHQKGILGGQDGARHVLDAHIAHLVQGRLGPNDGPGQQVAMTPKILGGGVDDKVGPPLQGALQIGGAVGVIHHRQGAVAAGDGGDGGDIDQAHVGVGG